MQNEPIVETFFVDTSPDDFLHAVERFSQELQSPLFSEKAAIYLQTAQKAGKYKGLPVGTFKIEIPALWSYPDGERVEVQMIEFEVTKVTSSRARVIAECTQPVAETPFRELLARLGEAYPEIREEHIAKARARAERILKAMAGTLPAEQDEAHAEKQKHHDSGHFRYGVEDRRRIVEEYRQAREAGDALNKDAWAGAKYGITGRTLLNYEREFPERET